jgi:hypothetical protein
MRWAIIIDGVVHNLIAWDGVSEWQPPAGSAVVQLGETEWCDIGCQYIADATPRFVAAEG